MTAALQTDEIGEKELAFIRGDNIKRAVTAAPTPEPANEREVIPPENQPTSMTAKTANKPSSRVIPSMMGLSTRIPAELQERLLRASFERKLEQREPFTHQDIIVEALTQWLKKAGHG